jgi:hypothetical protein
MRHKASAPVRFLLILLGTGVSLFATAQNNTKSPYSRFGLGDLAFNGLGQNSGMGQTGVGIRRTTMLNTLNPASFGNLTYTVFETGALLDQGTIADKNQNQFFRNASYAYLNLGFPVSSKLGWGASIGLQPVSHVGYNIDSYSWQGDSLATLFAYNGRGGLSKFYMGHGFTLWSASTKGEKNTRTLQHELKLGFQVSYIYGQLRIGKAAYFYDTTSTINNYKEDRTRYIGDVNYDLGLQYTTRVGKGEYLTMGATYQPASSLRGEQVLFARTLQPGSIDNTRDTIEFIEDGEAGTLLMPAAWGAGLSWQKEDKWMIALDVKGQNWEAYRLFGVSDSMQNSFSMHLGGMWIPDASAIKKRWKKAEYRAGVRYGNTNLMVRGEPIRELGISVGVGVPVFRQRSKINLSLEYYQRGTTDNRLLRENHFRFILGLSLGEKWFNRTKID